MKEKAVLVKRVDSGEEASLEELRDLAQAAGYAVAGEVTQSRRSDSSHEIGRGKAEEVRRLVERVGASKVIFDNELGPYRWLRGTRFETHLIRS